MDIIGTIQVDDEIERERNSAMIKATHALVAGLRLNNDIPKGAQDKCMHSAFIKLYGAIFYFTGTSDFLKTMH